MVYEEVLVEKEPIAVSSNRIPKLPALTRVSRQIRQQSRKIFHLRNNFRHTLDSKSSLTAYRKIVRKADLDADGFRNQISCELQGEWHHDFIGFLKCLRHFFLYGGKWPVARSSEKTCLHDLPFLQVQDYRQMQQG